LIKQFFDFEVFPNWWCCVVGLHQESKDNYQVFTSDDSAVREKLLSCLGNPSVVNFGYNCKRYDNIILNGVALGFTPQQLHILNEIIFNPEKATSSHEHFRISSFAKQRYKNFVYQDMLDDNTGSLKEKEASLQLDIRESDVPFDKKDLTKEDKADIIDYCKHDVWAGMQFYNKVLKPFIDTKLLVGKVFNIPTADCYRLTNAMLSGRVLGAVRRSYQDSTRADIVIPLPIRNYIRYALPADIVDRVCASPANFTVNLFGSEVSYANGGIHSVLEKKLFVQEDDEWALINIDAASFYPAIMIYFDLLSRSVVRADLFKEMYETRLRFKEAGDTSQEAKDISDAHKLILNTTYGASGNKYLALYDPYMTTNVCRVGQLLLTALANNMYNQIGKNNIRIVQTNTDGILVYIRRTHIKLLHAIGDEWTRATNILLEYEVEEKIWQRDVNNYILYSKDGKETVKGEFFITEAVNPRSNRIRPLNMYVCKEAVKYHLRDGKDIVEHIYNETDVSKFVVTASKGVFSRVVRSFNDGRPDEELHRTNRVYASLDTSFGMIYKIKRYKGEERKYKAPNCPEHCQLINDALSTYNINELRRDIDYMWYINKTIEMLDGTWFELRNNQIIPKNISYYI